MYDVTLVRSSGRTRYLSDHGLGQDLRPLGTSDDISRLEEDLSSVLDRFQIPVSPRRHRRQDGSVDELLQEDSVSTTLA